MKLAYLFSATATQQYTEVNLDTFVGMASYDSERAIGKIGGKGTGPKAGLSPHQARKSLFNRYFLFLQSLAWRSAGTLQAIQTLRYPPERRFT
jgi:hypothetical protein